MASSEEPRRWTILRHPLVVVAFGFLLSGIVGAGISHWITTRQHEAERSRMELDARQSAVQDLSREIYERRARAELVLSAIRRGARDDELRHRKQLYDEAYVRWNANIQANLFIVRDILREDEYSFIEHVIESMLVGNILSPLDRCITTAYDARLAGDEAVAVVDRCEARMLLQQALDCGYAITDELYKLLRGSADRPSAAAEISRHCPEGQ